MARSKDTELLFHQLLVSIPITLIHSFKPIKALSQIVNGAFLMLQRLPENNEEHQQERKSRCRDHDPEAITHCSLMSCQLQP